MTWYHTGGRRARTRISVRETKQRERERKQASEVSVDTGPRLEWPDRALGWLRRSDMVPTRRAALCLTLMKDGIFGWGVQESVQMMGLTRDAVKNRLRDAGLPAASRWMALGQILGGAELILERGETGMAAAKEVSLPTSSRLSELLHNHTGLRITTLPDLPTPRWRALVERWWEEWAG